MRRATVPFLCALTAVAITACSNDVVQIAASGTSGAGAGNATSTGAGAGSTGTGVGPPQTSSKIDLLLVIDNSSSMADKQAILAVTVPDLVTRLANPLCVYANGTPSQEQAPSPLAPCPPGTSREFAPIVDMHVGIVTSSLGGHGSDSCPAAGSPSNNDHGHLIARSSGFAGKNDLPTYDGKGFLAWDPAMALMPPGEADLAHLGSAIEKMVVGVDQRGCGFESQLEGWYRFLVDPAPYQSLSVDANGVTQRIGVDMELLQQRSDFLRPDSLLLVLELTDENDCSTKEFGQYWRSNQVADPSKGGMQFHLPPARSECKTNPDDPCCKSCAEPLGSCPADPACAVPLDGDSDNINVRCFDQKRRFGIDFLYPIDRYTRGLTDATIADATGEIVQNPIFAGGRNASLVFYAGIVGVPWQDLARDPKDLGQGYKNASELVATGAWNDVLGSTGAAPKDALMVESINPRTGVTPVTGQPLAPPGSPSEANAINGHEVSHPAHDGLEQACVFPIPSPVDCSTPQAICDCKGPEGIDNPVCSAANPSLQIKAKAYPGVRELELIRSLGDHGIPASICASNVADASAADFGYRPAMTAIVEAIKSRLVSN